VTGVDGQRHTRAPGLAAGATSWETKEADTGWDAKPSATAFAG
jgi:hypothetical protein